ncbi:hypothetical protein G6F43_004152 [Rhizopus delemar]|nr:hypothetical protein G6F43_004152 [Rhizopus delemar]
MPLLNRKKVPLAPTIPYESKRKRKEVWYLRSTNEVFDNYEDYINKLSLYHQAIWECEVTGRQNLTYEQALESERMEASRVEFKFSEVLRKMMLIRAQFQTVRLDELVDDMINYFKNNYLIGEIVQCTLNNNDYFARIVDVVPENRSSLDFIAAQQASSSSRQPTGRLRFPEAFVHPSSFESEKHFSTGKAYKVQLVDEHGRSLEEYIRTVGESSVRRDTSFNPRNIQCFIRECLYRDSYMGAPWLIKPNVAEAYSIDVTLPNHLKEAQDDFLKINKRRKTTKTNEEKAAEKRNRKEESLIQKAKLKEERDRQKEERKRQAAVKYPLEDLDLPIYRKDPLLNWFLVDMSPQKYNQQSMVIPYPSGGRAPRPVSHQESAIPNELLDSFLAVWSFLTVFAEPLKVAAYSVDEFEQALVASQPKAKVLAEYNACLLNVIIRERDDDTPNEIINGDVAENYVEQLEEEIDSDEEDDEDTKKEKPSVLPRVERGWQDKEQLRISHKWDHKELRTGSERRGWETSLIGCLNNVATPDMVPDLDQILQHLVPRVNSTAAEREKQYPTLSLKQKLDILEFLVNVVNESNLIKNYMEYCQEQITEYRKQKIELNKESKALSIKRTEMDKRDRAEKGSKADEDSGHSDDSDNESESNSDDSELSNERSLTREHKHQSRQDKLKQKQQERQEIEHTRKKTHDEQRNRANERRKLEEEEKILRKKEEHLERCMRRYMTLRIRPLGKDRFYNQYMYFDNIGVSNTYGSGRLYVQSPSDADIQLLMERDYLTDLPERHCGYGGGRWFVLRLMKDQGLVEESNWLENRMNELDSSNPGSYKGWWKYYSEPEEIEQLLSWLNPKGTRELKLKNEILKQQSNIIDSIKKRNNASLEIETTDLSKRSTRAKTTPKS